MKSSSLNKKEKAYKNSREAAEKLRSMMSKKYAIGRPRKLNK